MFFQKDKFFKQIILLCLVFFLSLGVLISSYYLQKTSSEVRTKATEQERPQAPNPIPPTSNYFIGSYYMPKETSMSRWWVMIDRYNQKYPDRKRFPSLGWYNQADRKVLDWQITWALDHGVFYWIFDEFWVQGQEFPRFKTMDTFFQSEYHQQIKFAVMLTGLNIRPKADYNELKEEYLKIARFWKNNYFNQPNYLNIDNKFLVVIQPIELMEKIAKSQGLDLSSISKDQFDSEIKPKTQEILNSMEQEAGVDILWGSMNIFYNKNDSLGWSFRTPTGRKRFLQDIKEIGFSFIAPYGCNGFLSNPREGILEIQSKPVDYAQFVRNCLDITEVYFNDSKETGMKFIPAFTPSFNDAPREPTDEPLEDINGESYDFSKFEEFLSDFKNFIDSKKTNPSDSNVFLYFEGKPLINSKAWNEWPEDSQLEPGINLLSKHGLPKGRPFRILDALWNTFSNKDNDHKRSHPSSPLATYYSFKWTGNETWDWEFNDSSDLEQWAIFAGATNLQLVQDEQNPNNYFARTRINTDLRLLGAVNFNVGDSNNSQNDDDKVVLRMRATCGGDSGCVSGAFLTWRSSEYKYNELLLKEDKKITSFIDDGQFHEYTIEVGKDNDWKGTIQEIILRVNTREERSPVYLDIDYIRIERVSIVTPTPPTPSVSPTPTPTSPPSISYPRIIYFSNEDGDYDLYLMDLNGQNKRKLFDTPFDEIDPSVSSDNQKIVYVSNEDGDYDLYVMNFNGQNKRKVFDTSGRGKDERNPFFTSDGQRIVYASNEDGDWDIYVYNLNTGSKQNLTNNRGINDRDPRISPNGKKIIYASNADRNFDIYVMNIDGSRKRQLTFTGSGIVNYPDGFFDNQTILFTSNLDGNLSLYKMKTDGTGRKKIFVTGGEYASIVPGEPKIVAEVRYKGDGDYELYLLNADPANPNPQRLTNNNFDDEYPFVFFPAEKTSLTFKLKFEGISEEKPNQPVKVVLTQNGVEKYSFE